MMLRGSALQTAQLHAIASGCASRAHGTNVCTRTRNRWVPLHVSQDCTGKGHNRALNPELAAFGGYFKAAYSKGEDPLG
jgi:hypothetical protein